VGRLGKLSTHSQGQVQVQRPHVHKCLGLGVLRRTVLHYVYGTLPVVTLEIFATAKKRKYSTIDVMIVQTQPQDPITAAGPHHVQAPF